MGSAGTEEECRQGSASESLQQPGLAAASTMKRLPRHPPPPPPCPGIDGALGPAPRSVRGPHVDRRECPAKRESTRQQSISSAPPLPDSRHSKRTTVESGISPPNLCVNQRVRI